MFKFRKQHYSSSKKKARPTGAKDKVSCVLRWPSPLALCDSIKIKSLSLSPLFVISAPTSNTTETGENVQAGRKFKPKQQQPDDSLNIVASIKRKKRFLSTKRNNKPRRRRSRNVLTTTNAKGLTYSSCISMFLYTNIQTANHLDSYCQRVF